MSLQIATVCASIAALSVAGVTIKDLDEIPENVDLRAPTILPKPDGFVSGLRYERQSQGGGSVAKGDCYYTLTYRLCYAPVGSGRGLFETYPAMVTAAFAFLDAVLAVDVLQGAVTIRPVGALNFGPVSDPAGNIFHGCDIAVEIMEFVN